MQNERTAGPSPVRNVALVEDALLLDRAGLWTDVFRGAEEEQRRLRDELAEAHRRAAAGEQRWATQCQALRVQLAAAQQQLLQATKGQTEVLRLRNDVNTLNQALVDAQEARSTLLEENATLARDLRVAQEEVQAQRERCAGLEDELHRVEDEGAAQRPSGASDGEGSSPGITCAVPPNILVVQPVGSKRLAGEAFCEREQPGEAEDPCAQLRAELGVVAAAHQTALDRWHGAQAMREALRRENEQLRAQLLDGQHQKAEEFAALLTQLANLQADHDRVQQALDVTRVEAEDVRRQLAGQREQWLEAERRAMVVQQEMQCLRATESAAREEVEQLKAEGWDLRAALKREVEATAVLHGRHLDLMSQTETEQPRRPAEVCIELEAAVRELQAQRAQAEQQAAESAKVHRAQLESLRREVHDAEVTRQEALDQAAGIARALQDSEAGRSDVRRVQEQCLEEVRQRLKQEAARHEREERLLRSQVVELTAQREALQVEAMQAQVRADQCVAMAAQRAQREVDGEREARAMAEAQHRTQLDVVEAHLLAAEERCAELHAVLELRVEELHQLREEKEAEQRRANEVAAALETETAKWDRERSRLLSRLQDCKEKERQLVQQHGVEMRNRQEALEDARRQSEAQAEAHAASVRQVAEKHRRRLSEVTRDRRQAESEAEAANQRDMAAVRSEAAAAQATLKRENAVLAQELDATVMELQRLRGQASELSQMEVQCARFEVGTDLRLQQDNEALQREVVSWQAAFTNLEAKLHQGVAERRELEAEHQSVLARVVEGRQREAEGYEALVQQLRALTEERAWAAQEVAAAGEQLARARQGWEAERAQLVAQHQAVQDSAARELQGVREALQAQEAARRLLLPLLPGAPVEAVTQHVLALRLQAEALATAVAALSGIIPTIGRGLQALRKQDGAVTQFVREILAGTKAAEASYTALREEMEAGRQLWNDQLRLLRMENASLKSLLEAAQAAVVYARQRETSLLTHTTPIRSSRRISGESQSFVAMDTTPRHPIIALGVDKPANQPDTTIPFRIVSPNSTALSVASQVFPRTPPTAAMPNDHKVIPSASPTTMLSTPRLSTSTSAIRSSSSSSSSSSSRLQSYASQRLATIEHGKRSSSARAGTHQKRPP